MSDKWSKDYLQRGSGDFLGSIPVAAAVLERTSVVLAWNTLAQNLFGWAAEDVVEHPMMGLSHYERGRLRALLSYVINSRHLADGLFTIQDKHGKSIDTVLSLMAWPVTTGIDAPITCTFHVDRKDLSLRKTREIKSVALGRLSSVLAHDLKNILINIDSRASLLRPGFAANDSAATQLDRILEQTRQGLAYVSSVCPLRVALPETLEVNSFIERRKLKCERLLGDDIALSLSLSSVPLNVACDQVELEKVMLTLIDNARDALPTGGVVRITTEGVLEPVDELGPANDYAKITVVDNGPGLDGSVTGRLFEPFVTTKTGRRGLSLAIAYRAVRGFKGLLTHDSLREAGTSFTIHLPLIDDEPKTSAPVGEELNKNEFRGTETVMLVEDDTGVRGLMATQLRTRGYTVIEANGWDDALAIHAESRGLIQLLVADVNLAGPQTGVMLSDALKATQPELKTLFVSGYTDAKLRDGSLLPAGVNFAQKPFNSADFARSVRRVLAGEHVQPTPDSQSGL
jgi:two-component system, cell cycle sensor histidine kinase and response regulator CckA